MFLFDLGLAGKGKFRRALSLAYSLNNQHPPSTHQMNGIANGHGPPWGPGWQAGWTGKGPQSSLCFPAAAERNDGVISAVNISTRQWEVAVAPEGCTRQCRRGKALLVRVAMRLSISCVSLLCLGVISGKKTAWGQTRGRVELRVEWWSRDVHKRWLEIVPLLLQRRTVERWSDVSSQVDKRMGMETHFIGYLCSMK